MGIASFVIGLTCLLLSPFLSIFLILPSILGLILGIIDTILKAKNKKSKGLSIAGIVLSTIALALCILIGIGVYIFTTNAIAENINSNSTLSDSIDGIISSDVKCNLGESATFDDIKVTFKDIDLDFKDYDENAYITDGYKVIKADFEFENVGSSYAYISYYDFECYADMFSCDTFYFVDDYYFTSSLKPNEKLSASVYFEVPKDAKTIELEYDSNAYDDGKIIFSVDNNEK